MNNDSLSGRPWRSEHFRDGRFFNPDTSAQDLKKLLRWILHRKPGPWRKWIPSTPGAPPPRRIVGTALRVTFVNHSTFLLQTEGLNVLTDPVWSERVSPVRFAGPRRHRAPGILFDDMPQIDAILLSHNHYDHCDVATLRALVRRDAPAIFCPLGVAEFVHRLGFRQIYEMDWWARTEWRGVPVHCVPAQHFASRTPFDRDRTLWCGWVLNPAAGAIYFAGDTGFGSLFAEIARELPRIRLALLPIGAYAPEWFMGPIHMTPEQAVEAHSILRAAQSVAAHYGTFALADDGETEPIERLQAVLSAVPDSKKFLVIQEGSGIDISKY